MNSVNIIVRLGRDPELKTSQGGTAICTFSGAFDQGKDKDAGWVDVACFGNTAEAVNQYLGKGDEAAVSGYLSYRSWQGDDGKTRSKLEVAAQRVDFLRKKSGGERAEEADRDIDADPFGDQ